MGQSVLSVALWFSKAGRRKVAGGKFDFSVADPQKEVPIISADAHRERHEFIEGEIQRRWGEVMRDLASQLVSTGPEDEGAATSGAGIPGFVRFRGGAPTSS